MARTRAEGRWQCISRNVKRYKRLHQRRRFRLPFPQQLYSNLHSLPPTTSSPIRSQQFYNAQAHCALFAKLPTEVRLMIWKATIGGLEIHITPKRHPAVSAIYVSGVDHSFLDDGCYTCSHNIVHADATLTYTACKNEDISGPEYECARNHIHSRGLGLLSLLKTCRRIYFEAIPALYQSNVFTFTQCEIIQVFGASIPSQHWELIQSVHLLMLEQYGQIRLWNNVFRDSCIDIKSLKGLQRFTLSILQNLEGSDTEEIVNTLKPLKGFSTTVKLELRIEGSWEWWKTLNSELNAAGLRCNVTSYMRALLNY